jgi:hypothetical protein
VESIDNGPVLVDHDVVIFGSKRLHPCFFRVPEVTVQFLHSESNELHILGMIGKPNVPTSLSLLLENSVCSLRRELWNTYGATKPAKIYHASLR